MTALIARSFVGSCPRSAGPSARMPSGTPPAWASMYPDPSGQTSPNPVSPSSVEILTIVVVKSLTE